jgi:hypothetical protein
MIPIECPKCGRGGSVPPDRLNARLVCKACHTVFHLDNTGRMVLGEPESFDMKTNKSRADEVSSLADFDFAQTWNDIPKPIKFGVPGVFLALMGYLYIDLGSGSPDYIGKAESIIKAVAANNKDKAVSYATTDSSEAAGQWFDMLHVELEKNDIGSDVSVSPALFAGNAEKDDEITLLVVLSKNGGGGAPVTITLPMKRDGTSWKLEGNKGLEDAAKAKASSTSTKNKR